MRPRWRSIADELTRQIEAGDLKPGDQLPTELELQVEYDVSRNTVRDAIKYLIQRQLVVTHAGSGTFVMRKIKPFEVELSPHQDLGAGGDEGSTYVASARIQGREPSFSEPRVEILKATPLISARLRIDEGARVISRHQQRFIDGAPWSLQTSCYPMEFVYRGAEKLVDAVDIEEGVVKYLQAQLGLTQIGYQDRITARIPSQEEAAFFGAESADLTVIELSRTAYDTSGEPLRFTTTVYPADRNMLFYNFGEVAGA